MFYVAAKILRDASQDRRNFPGLLIGLGIAMLLMLATTPARAFDNLDIATVGDLPTLVIDLNNLIEPRENREGELYDKVFSGDEAGSGYWIDQVSRSQAQLVGDVISLHMPELYGVLSQNELLDGTPMSDIEVLQTILTEAALQVDLTGYDRVLIAGHTLNRGPQAWRVPLPGTSGENLTDYIWVAARGLSNNFASLHELGHTLNLPHSQGLNCLDGSVGTNCRIQEYGGVYDTMGTTGNHTPDYNAVHQEKLGWMNVADGHGLTVESSNTYTLNAFELGEGVRYLKIPDQNAESEDVYYVECRSQRSRSSHLNPWNHCQVLVYLHFLEDSQLLQSVLLDMNVLNNIPPEDPVERFFFQIPRDPMVPGGVFEDAVRGIRITHLGSTAQEATLDIELFEAAPMQAPVITILSPEENAEVFGRTVEVQIQAEDERLVRQVVVSAGAGNLHKRLDVTKTPGPYIFEWDTTDHTDGPRTLLVTVTDVAGSITTQERVVQIANLGQDLEPPQLTLVGISHGSVGPTSTYINSYGEVAGNMIFNVDMVDNSAISDPSHWSVHANVTFRSMANGALYSHTARWSNSGVPIENGSRSPVVIDPIFSRFYLVEPPLISNDTAEAEMAFQSYNASILFLENDASFMFPPPERLAEGNYELSMVGADKAGNVAWSEGVVVGITRTPNVSRASAYGRFVRGDANGDGRVDISDGIATLQYLFVGGDLGEENCQDAADFDDSGDLQVTDAIRSFDFLFQGGPPPDQPFPLPMVDATYDALTCGDGTPHPDDVDNDGDGFSETEGDCDDTDTAINPDGVEIINDNIDQDCNGQDLVTCAADYMIASQAQLNSMVHCGIIDGYLYIQANVTNLLPLHNLTTITDHLVIRNTSALTNLSGLEQLHTVEEFVSIQQNAALLDLEGLSTLNSVGDNFYIHDNGFLCQTEVDAVFADENLSIVGSATSYGNNDGC